MSNRYGLEDIIYQDENNIYDRDSLLCMEPEKNIQNLAGLY